VCWAATLEGEEVTGARRRHVDCIVEPIRIERKESIMLTWVIVLFVVAPIVTMAALAVAAAIILNGGVPAAITSAASAVL
jgi:hypothetical protein